MVSKGECGYLTRAASRSHSYAVSRNLTLWLRDIYFFGVSGLSMTYACSKSYVLIFSLE